MQGFHQLLSADTTHCEPRLQSSHDQTGHALPSLVREIDVVGLGETFLE